MDRVTHTLTALRHGYAQCMAQLVTRILSTDRALPPSTNLQPIRKSILTQRIGSLPFPRTAICQTLGAVADC